MFFVDELRRFFIKNKIPAFTMSLKWIKEEPSIVKKRNITHSKSLVYTHHSYGHLFHITGQVLKPPHAHAWI